MLKGSDWRGAEVFAEAAQTGESIPKPDLKAIRKFTRTDVPPEDLYVFPVLAIDDQPTRNMVIYSAESQKLSLRKWVGIPFLFNSTGNSDFFGGADHRLAASSQYARIFKSALVETPQGHTGTLVWVYTARNVDQQVDSFINKLDVGILREVSIHVVPTPVTGINCSICKVPFSDEKCQEKNHYPGTKYDGKMCYMETAGAYTPLELSSVACPGSIIAHVMDDSEVASMAKLKLSEALHTSFALGETDMSTTAIKTAEELAADQAETQRVADETAAAETARLAAEAAEAAKTQADPPEDEAKDDDGGSGDTKAKKQSFVIFEGACVACGRDGKPVTAEQKTVDEEVTAIREAATTQVTAIAEAAQTKVTAAEAARDAAIARAEQFDAIFTDFVAETADLAIAKGIKEAAQREGYTQELSALSYSAVKVVRETLAASASKPEEKRKQLVESMKDRHSKNASTTQTTTTADGKTASTSERKLFSNKNLGPNSGSNR
ncbi:MAG: hypothetical protein ACYDBO_02210 [Vulcanimicrobiaceae bacterium]